MHQCPQCKHTVALQDLAAEVAALEKRLAPPRLASLSSGSMPAMAFSGSISGFGGAGGKIINAGADDDDDEKTRIDIPTGVRVCANCGYHWTPDARTKARKLVERIRKLKMKLGGPVEAIGDLDRPEL